MTDSPRPACVPGWLALAKNCAQGTGWPRNWASEWIEPLTAPLASVLSAGGTRASGCLLRDPIQSSLGPPPASDPEIRLQATVPPSRGGSFFLRECSSAHLGFCYRRFSARSTPQSCCSADPLRRLARPSGVRSLFCTSLMLSGRQRYRRRSSRRGLVNWRRKLSSRINDGSLACSSIPERCPLPSGAAYVLGSSRHGPADFVADIGTTTRSKNIFPSHRPNFPLYSTRCSVRVRDDVSCQTAIVSCA